MIVLIDFYNEFILKSLLKAEIEKKKFGTDKTTYYFQ